MAEAAGRADRSAAANAGPFGKRVEGFKTTLAWLNKVLVAQGRIADEDKRLAAAWDTFVATYEKVHRAAMGTLRAIAAVHTC